MQPCPHFRNCRYHTEHFARLPAFIRLYKAQYCFGSFEGCQRYRMKEKLARAMELAPVPAEEDTVLQDAG